MIVSHYETVSLKNSDNTFWKEQWKLVLYLKPAAEAESDYGNLTRALRFYESCGAQIAGLAHIHHENLMEFFLALSLVKILVFLT